MDETNVDPDNLSPEETAEIEVLYEQLAKILGEVAQINDDCWEQLKRVLAILKRG